MNRLIHKTMKNYKSIVTVLFTYIIMSVTATSAMGQKNSKNDTVRIKTSIQCEMCEERIMENLPFEKGVKDIRIDIKSKMVTVVFRNDKTDAHALRESISDIGYDADDVPADPDAYAKLPECCKKGGHPEM